MCMTYFGSMEPPVIISQRAIRFLQDEFPERMDLIVMVNDIDEKYELVEFSWAGPRNCFDNDGVLHINTNHPDGFKFKMEYKKYYSWGRSIGIITFN